MVFVKKMEKKMSANALHFHKDEHEWLDDDGEYFDCLEERLAHLLQLTLKEREDFLGDE